MKAPALRRALAAAFIILLHTPLHAQVETARKTFAYAVQSGERISDFVSGLAARGIAAKEAFLDIAADAEFPRYPFVPRRQRSLSRFEGLFPPGVYRLDASGASSVETCRRIVDQLLAASAERLARIDPSPVRGLYGDVILASIVQKEAAAGRDYDKVASVFANRLQLGMPLASCPAVEYALGYHRPFLLRSDILIASPYNLYLHRGLTPTPIAAFTDEALKAVVRPADTPYLFFTFDWVRRVLYFDSTYAGHRKNTDTAIRDYIMAYGEKALVRKQPGVFYESAPDGAAG